MTQKLILNRSRRRESCSVCHRQSKRPEGLGNFTCFQCGLSYNSNGFIDWSHEISKKKLYDEFSCAGITLSDGEVEKIFRQCYYMANRTDVKVRIAFQSILAGIINEFKSRGWHRDKRNRKIGILNSSGKHIARET